MRRSLLSVFVAALAGVAGVAPAHAGIRAWSTNGPSSGGQIGGIAIDPSNPDIVYVGYFGRGEGVWKTTDGGVTWSATGLAGLGRFAVALVIDPSKPSTLYAGTDQMGVFKTTDGGQSWTAANAGLPDTSKVRSLVIDPSNPAILYAGFWLGGYSGSAGVFKTTDGGQSWTAVGAGLPNDSEAYGLAIAPSNPAILYAGTWSDRALLFTSTDGGQS